MKDPLLEVQNLKKYFQLNRNETLKAVDGVSFTLYEGETLGIVGESGCGKSTLGRTILGLYDKTEGDVRYKGKDYLQTRQDRFQLTKEMQMIFQDPYASLNPRSTVYDLISEPMDIHGLYPNKKDRRRRVEELLQEVGLTKEHLYRYPHEFSGGQRQRIGIARALALEPSMIIADEPLSALDVSIQAQVVYLLKQIQKEKGLTFLFIAHDLSLVKYMSDRVGVMYLGQLVELTSSDKLYQHPLHPYTEALLSAIPIPDPDIEEKRERIILEGDLPSPINPPSGCVFRTRCPHVMDICAQVKPNFNEIDKDHFVACHLYQQQREDKKSTEAGVTN
ncbi:ATP-binding cassette domain-containing protein [Terrilactibacillus sp. BCM23-1]|uniref:ATP-binding cassette domain-containing protein n=1 Tax=Terrilactibacillus tamarindi TaxID=2599694 RepID=A0A6N8CT94_9BACI|nr:oligopeptide/dipeptide ABC transporter ATP-binding protein [Terrilactibacillus tamarindi]MTT32950.1 ATP-binding cassette domain-containing protein [Terrilactibacillus tamarindi]